MAATDNDHINSCNSRLQKIQRQAGRSFVSRTTLDSTDGNGGHLITALRAVLANPLTAESDIDAVLEEQKEIGASLH